MKKITIISVMLTMALTISAQNNRSRTANSNEKAKTTATRSKSDNTKEVNSSKSAVKPSPAVRTRTNTSTSRSSSPANRSRSAGNVSRSSSDRVSTSTSGRNSRSSSVGSGVSGPDRTRTTTTTTTRTRSAQPGNAVSTQRNTRAANNGSDNRRVATTTSRTTNRTANPLPSSRRISRPDEYRPVNRTTYSAERKVYHSYHPNRVVRTAPVIRYNIKPVEYRRVHNPYTKPVYREIYWNMNMYNEYIYLYPNYHYWYHPFGYKIQTVSAYDASSFVGDIARIYGRVYDTWYSRENDEYYLYFGGPYPYNDFSVILDGNDARRFNWRPDRYFKNRNVLVTGLVGYFNDKPEMIIKNRSQIEVY